MGIHGTQIWENASALLQGKSKVWVGSHAPSGMVAPIDFHPERRAGIPLCIASLAGRITRALEANCMMLHEFCIKGTLSSL